MHEYDNRNVLIHLPPLYMPCCKLGIIENNVKDKHLGTFVAFEIIYSLEMNELMNELIDYI